MLLDDANALARKLRDSDEYRAYLDAKERAYENASTAAMLDEFFVLRRRFRENEQRGERDELLEQKLMKMGELLQFDRDAAAFLLAEYHLNELMGNIFMTLAKAVDFHLVGDA